MRLITTTSIIALALASSACAQEDASYDVAEPAVAQETPMAETQDALETDAYGTTDAYGETTVAQDDPYAAEPIRGEDGTVMQDDYEDGYAAPQDYASDSYAADPSMTASLAEDDVLNETRDEFASADTDGDGQLSRDEFVTAMASALPAEATEDTVTDPYADEVDGEMASDDSYDTASVDPSEYLTAKFEKISGGDEAVTLDELEEDRKGDFAEADTDGDDVLQGEEVETFAQLKSGRTTTY